VPPKTLERRTFLQVLGSSLALGGLGGCFQSPKERIFPFVRQPIEMTPGNALHYATAWTLSGVATGLLVTTREGRPIKVEGNPDHPATLGATGAMEQAAVHHLYDPSRARTFRRGPRTMGSREFFAWLQEHAQALKHKRGEGLALLLEPSGSPTRARMLEELRGAYPMSQILAYDAGVSTFAREGAELAFARPLDLVPHLGATEVVVSLGSDFLSPTPSTLRGIRDFARTREPSPQMSRLYVAESHVTVTGGMADHRLRITPSRTGTLLGAICRELAALSGHSTLGALPVTREGLSHFEQRFADAAAKDLWAHRAHSLLLIGESHPPILHAVAHACNAALGSQGKSFSLIEPVLSPAPAPMSQLRALTEDLRAGKVQTLLISGFDPVYTAPGDLGFREALEKVPERIYLGYHEDQTARASTAFAPLAHPFEAWGDARAPDGTVSVVQPLLAPLFEGISELELLAAFAGAEDLDIHRRVKNTWRERSGEVGFETRWEDWLVQGFIPGTQSPPVRAEVSFEAIVKATKTVATASAPSEPGSSTLQLELIADPKVYDGRFAHVAWLQELGDPITKITWDNAAQMSPATAARLGLSQAERVRLTTGGNTLEVPVWISPGQADDTVTLALGYGEVGPNGDPVGFNAYALRRSPSPWHDALSVTRLTGKKYAFATVQEHWRLEGRELALEKSLADFVAHPDALTELRTQGPALYHPGFGEGAEYKWAMAVDLNRCTGCSACVVACSVENNIPTVGKEGVARSREMHWIRIDRYFSGEVHDPGVITQPMLCQHCETAPCEYVCPVDATVHSDEGLNQQVYNRCIGTRYCSNNCPYKVRRFNFFDYHPNPSSTERLSQNPDVTVRARGVIEKCTYCVQRIERARISTRREGRRIADGELMTACQQACPTEAITFGSLLDVDGKVARLHRDPRRYDVLGELGTRPRTAYLVRIRNPNPELGG
jgi:molybdopterin-containing oxidoreductase family iron-sulfur binding subunit